MLIQPGNGGVRRAEIDANGRRVIGHWLLASSLRLLLSAINSVGYWPVGDD
jgi:hypothetical protein